MPLAGSIQALIVTGILLVESRDEIGEVADNCGPAAGGKDNPSPVDGSKIGAPRDRSFGPLKEGKSPGADDADGGNVDRGTCENSRGGAEVSGKVLSNPYKVWVPKPERSKGLVEGMGSIPKLPIAVPSGSKVCPNAGNTEVPITGIISTVVAGKISIAMILV